MKYGCDIAALAEMRWPGSYRSICVRRSKPSEQSLGAVVAKETCSHSEDDVSEHVVGLCRAWGRWCTDISPPCAVHVHACVCLCACVCVCVCGGGVKVRGEGLERGRRVKGEGEG